MKLAIPFLALLASPAAAQTPFDGCGTVVQGVTCRLFNPDTGGLYILDVDLTPYAIGEHLRVVGTIDPSCISFCLQGDGCITTSLVTSCSPATDLCFGDGTQGACPCSNSGAPGHGCANSQNPSGALLSVTGATNPDTIVLTSSGERPTSLSIFFQGQSGLAVPVFAGDGLRCVNTNLKRLYVKNAVSGVAAAPQGGDPSITQRSAALNDPIAPGTSRHYQVFYRDGTAAFCPSPPGSTFNTTNAKSILW